MSSSEQLDSLTQSESLAQLPRGPEWLRRPSGSATETAELKRMLRGAGLLIPFVRRRAVPISQSALEEAQRRL